MLLRRVGEGDRLTDRHKVCLQQCWNMLLCRVGEGDRLTDRYTDRRAGRQINQATE